jgi:hypothetical protein
MPTYNIDHDEMLDAVKTICEEDRTDPLEGGAAPATVADDLGVSPDAAMRNLRALVEAGDLVQVWGGDPETLRPRRSYLPPDHPYLSPPHERD